MAKMAEEKIQAEVEALGYELVDASKYENLLSPILIRCKQDHLIEVSLTNLRKVSFTCPCCDKAIESHQLFCDKCFHQITFIKKPMCYRCGQPLLLEKAKGKVLCPDCLKKRPLYDIARAAFIYDSASKASILKLKYTDRMEYAYPLVELLYQAGCDLFSKTDIIMPVPMHWRRRLKRKYNQADLLGRLLAKKTHILYSSKNLIRSRHTEVQENKTLSERNKNVKDAFCIKKPQEIQNKIENTLYQSGSRIYDVQSYPIKDIKEITQPNIDPTITTYPEY